MINLTGKKVCVIGEFTNYTKEEVGQLVLNAGGTLVTESRKDIDFFIAGKVNNFTLSGNPDGRVPDVKSEKFVDELKVENGEF